MEYLFYPGTCKNQEDPPVCPKCNMDTHTHSSSRSSSDHLLKCAAFPVLLTKGPSNKTEVKYMYIVQTHRAIPAKAV